MLCPLSTRSRSGLKARPVLSYFCSFLICLTLELVAIYLGLIENWMISFINCGSAKALGYIEQDRARCHRAFSKLSNAFMALSIFLFKKLAGWHALPS
jgi:hypothetical protein